MKTAAPYEDVTIGERNLDMPMEGGTGPEHGNVTNGESTSTINVTPEEAWRLDSALQNVRDVLDALPDVEVDVSPMRGMQDLSPLLAPADMECMEADGALTALTQHSLDLLEIEDDGANDEKHPRGLYQIVKVGREEQNAAVVPKLHAPRAEYHRLSNDVRGGSSQSVATRIDFKGLDEQMNLKVVGLPGPSELVQEYLQSKVGLSSTFSLSLFFQAHDKSCVCAWPKLDPPEANLWC